MINEPCGIEKSEHIDEELICHLWNDTYIEGPVDLTEYKRLHHCFHGLIMFSFVSDEALEEIHLLQQILADTINPEPGHYLFLGER